MLYSTEYLIYGLFFGFPLAAVIFFVVSLVRYVRVKRSGADPQERKKRGILLIVSSIVAGALLAVVVGFIALLMMAIAFM